MKHISLKLHHKSPAFTMLELIFVIIVVGILAALAIPRIDRDLKQEAADTILSNIRYTQHLALMDNKHKFDDPKWHRRFWRIVFGTCSTGMNDHFFMIGTDDNMTGSTNGYFSKEEAALDPVNGKPLFWKNGVDCSHGGDGTVSENIFISKKFGIIGITPSGGCTSKYIGFDHLGRPHVNFGNSSVPNYSTVMSQICTLTFTMSDGSNFQINITPQTGSASIVGQPDS